MEAFKYENIGERRPYRTVLNSISYLRNVLVSRVTHIQS